MSGGPNSPEESIFNDVTQRLPSQTDNAALPLSNGTGQTESEIPKPKRIACVLCRKRKLRCDGTRPACGTCKRLSHDCTYDEVRRKSGPKRGYVKLLEQRLQQVETLLKNQDPPEQIQKDRTPVPAAPASSIPYTSDAPAVQPSNGDHSMFNTGGMSPGDPSAHLSSVPEGNEDPYGWEMIGLGLDEPLPPPEDINELNRIYFTKIHPSGPMIHKRRFYAAMNLAPHMRPAVCLRYIMWCLAASMSEKYESLQELFYQRARKYAQSDEMRGHGESTLTLAHCQAWVLMSTYEFKMMYFPRAWMSSGRASRLALMMGLGRQDGIGLDVKQCLPPPKDWTEREERRRTFWGAFCVDRYASIGTGWPMCIDEQDISSNLPVSDEAFDNNKPVASISLQQAFTPEGTRSVSSFGGVITTACLFGRNLHHLHRPTPEDNESDLKGAFWRRHQEMDNTLLSLSLNLPDNLRLPGAMASANAIFFNLCLQTSVICLHQAAIFKCDKFRLPPHVATESKKRAINAAAEVANIMRSICHMDLAAINPFISFCVYVASRVFVQYVKTRPQDTTMQASLQFLLQSMLALRRRNPLTQSFMVQLDLDLDGAGIQGIRMNGETTAQSQQESDVPGSDGVGCSPIFEIRDTQNGHHHQATHLQGPEAPDKPASLSSSSSPSSAAQNLYQPSRRAMTQGVPTGIIVPIHGDASTNSTSEMDTDYGRDTPSTTNSRQGSTTSHPSYTPPATNIDETIHNPQAFTTNSMHSSLNAGVSLSMNGMNANDVTAGFFNTPEDYVGMNGHYYTTNGLHDPAPSGYQMTNDFSFNTAAATAAMADSGWSQMLDGMGMSWEPMAMPQQPINHAGDGRTYQG